MAVQSLGQPGPVLVADEEGMMGEVHAGVVHDSYMLGEGGQLVGVGDRHHMLC